MMRAIKRLYIPIWFYSNLPFNLAKLTKEFTLHSNLVLFKYEQPFGYNDGVFGLYIPIWFYSNLSVAGTLSVTEDALHSNLVLFKFVRDTKKKKSQAFTFQSGSIQILYVQYDRDYRDTFTFQSGSIQIIRFIS